ncbi:prealbumin-like fold domain-containing protein [Sphingobacterium sp. JB170]|uniref:prealbumin-like fold domain-containing protein n=1 Tax=Sphingobacterium sp. JB170 TaxID=1434842 RepID=UPI00097F6AC6|nr:prealbumin-like fold domain-containing protein [Sphingobacterium sp. JB170]SJN18427.1 hypothetical protein FM107_01345 [Sphingobacterium sp. JB170]
MKKIVLMFFIGLTGITFSCKNSNNLPEPKKYARDFEISIIDERDNPLEGAKAVLYSKADLDESIDSDVSTTSGSIKFPKLNLGDYHIVIFWQEKEVKTLDFTIRLEGVAFAEVSVNTIPETEYVLYPNFPESFEQNQAWAETWKISFPSGNWKSNKSSIRDQATDVIASGKYAWRADWNNTVPICLEMNFDVPNGASMVSLYYGSFGIDPSCTWQLEYSTDQGNIWSQVGEPISAESRTPKQVIFEVDIDEPVRFRVHKLSLGTSNETVKNGRLNIDEFAIYHK